MNKTNKRLEHTAGQGCGRRYLKNSQKASGYEQNSTRQQVCLPAARHSLYIVSIDCSVWFTAAFTFDRFVAICCLNFKRYFCCLKTAAVIIFVVFGASILKSIPVYFVYKPVLVIRSLPWFCRGKAEFWDSTYWKLYQRGSMFVTFLLPILLISLFNALTVRYIIAANRVRRKLRSNVGNNSDQEAENRRKSIVLLFAVSANVILLWMPKAVYTLNWQLQNYNYGNKYLNIPVYVAQQMDSRLYAIKVDIEEQVTPRKFNLMAIAILTRRKCGLTKCITIYLVGMATADLLGVIIAVVLEQINNIYVYARFLLITPICAVTHVLRLAIMDCSVWLTVAFTFDRCIAICSQRLRERYCTERTANVVIVIVCVGSCARYAPCYNSVEPYIIVDNVPWRCIGSAEYFTSAVWKAYQMFNTITTPLLPIGLIVLFNAITIRHIIMANRIRRELRQSSDNRKDPEVENRRYSMILLFALSGNFILLWIPFVVYTMNWKIQNYYYTDRYFSNRTYIMQQFGFMLQFLCTCTNTCIYTMSQRKFREELKKGVRYLVTINGVFWK
ncbi:uncharacterized protein LOC134338714 [Mobula hypostoma]|uniref:uncharacterized protein LOC134338714 n=1 Tax=Mobula hypostoma TaxID=723540 RepID=UPI002FC2F07A